MIYNILDYGAVADGVTLNNKAVQAAIDACAATGGTVLFPAGTFVLSTVFLKSGVRIELAEGCEILGTVKNSVLGAGVKVEYGAVVKDSVIMDGTVVREGASVKYSIIDSDCDIGEGAHVGAEKKKASGIAVIGRGYRVEPGAVVEPSAMLSDD